MDGSISFSLHIYDGAQVFRIYVSTPLYVYSAILNIHYIVDVYIMFNIARPRDDQFVYAYFIRVTQLGPRFLTLTDLEIGFISKLHMRMDALMHIKMPAVIWLL